MTEALFSNYGIRGNVSDVLDVKSALTLGRAIGQYFKGEVAVSTDRNATSKMIQHSLVSGILASGCDVKQLGVLPQYVLQMAVMKDSNLSGGVMISDPDSNGNVRIKCIFNTGIPLSLGAEEKIHSFLDNLAPRKEGERYGRRRQSVDPTKDYFESITKSINHLLVRESGVSVVVDCAGCTAAAVISELLVKLGVKANVLNSFVGQTQDATLKERMERVGRLVVETHSIFGAVLESDGNAIRFIDDNGNELIDDHMLDVFIKNKLSTASGPVVYSTYSMDLVKNFIFTNGGTPVRVHYGTESIIDAMKSNDAVFGGEYFKAIFPEHQYCVDPGIMIAKMVESIVKFGPLHEIISSLPSRFKITKVIPCADGVKPGVFDMLKDVHILFVKEDELGLSVQFDDCTMYVIDHAEGEIAVVAESLFMKITESRMEAICSEIENYINA